MPIPVSEISKATWSFCTVALTVIVPFLGVNFRALLMRFIKTLSIWLASMDTPGKCGSV